MKLTDSELGRALLSLRGYQWLRGIHHDPYALLLRAESDDPAQLGRCCVNAASTAATPAPGSPRTMRRPPGCSPTRASCCAARRPGPPPAPGTSCRGKRPR
ncbi:hypothetical protein ACFQ3Z_36345 [Streptomyces nogalater]